MAMPWQPMPGQTWFGALAMFVAMWTPMMAAMMLPSLVPVLVRRRDVVRRSGAAHPGASVTVTVLAYACVWSVIGIVAYAVGTALSAFVVRQPVLTRLAPLAIGLLVASAGALQFTSWQLRQLTCWRDVAVHDTSSPATLRAAWRVGLQLGVHCVQGSAALMVALLCIGMTNVVAMVLVTVAVSLERLARDARRAAQLVGGATLVVGACLIAQALG